MRAKEYVCFYISLNTIYNALHILKWENLFIFAVSWDFSEEILFSEGINAVI